MLKALRKAVAVLVTIAFVVGLVPGIALAESTTATVKFINGAVTRSSSGSMDAAATQNYHWTLGDYYGTPVLTTGNSYRGFAQMDFTGYEAILNSPSTTINYNVVSGGYSSQVMRDLRAIIQPGLVDDSYDADTMTYSIANGLGMLNTADKPVLFIENDGSDTPAGGIINSAADITALKAALNEDTDDSVITLYFESLGSGDNNIRLSSASGIQINYVESEIDNQAYVTGIAQGMTWDRVSSQSANSVSANITLPSKYLGADVVWASSNSDAVNAETGVVTPVKDVAQTATLTATLTYKGVVGEEATATATFDVTVPAIAMSKVIVDNSKVLYKRWTRGGSHESIYQGVPQYGDYPVHNSVGYATNDRQTYFKVDLSGLEKYINVAKNVNFTLTGSSRQSTEGNMEVALLSAKNDTAWDDGTNITYKYTIDSGMRYDTGCFSYEFPISQNVTFSSADFAAGLKEELQADPTNSTITLRFDGTSSYTSQMNLHHPQLTLEIEYYEDELSDSDFINDIKGKLTWDKISNQSINVISGNINLPKAYYGYPVTWASSNEDVVSSSDGTVTVSETTKYDVTLTATINYGTTTETKEFNLVVPKKMIILENINDGSKALGTAGVVSTVEANGIGGKALNDSYISFANTSGAYYGMPTDAADGQDDVFEFSALVPEGAEGMHFYVGIFGTTGQQDSGRMTLPFTLKEDGVYYGFTAQSYKIIDFDCTKWTNYAIVPPRGMTGAVASDGSSLDDDTWELYINGVKAFEHSAQITNGGIAYIRLYTYSDSINNPTIYFDNVRVYSGEYVPSYDTLSSFEASNGIVDDKIVLDDSSAKLADVLDGISVDDDAVIRVYDEAGALVTDYTQFASDKKIVVADRNGTTLERSYATYEIVDAVGREAVFGDPYLTWVNGKVNGRISVLNCSDKTVNYQVYLAVYNDGELTEIVPAMLSADAGKSATVTPSVSVTKLQSTKLFVWDADGITPELDFIEYK